MKEKRWGLDANAETAQTAVSPGQDAKTAVTKNAPTSKRKHSACITPCSTATSPHAGTSSGSRGPRCCCHGNRSPLACSCLLSNWTPRLESRPPRPSAAPLPPPGRAAGTLCTDGDPDLLTGLKFLLKRSSDHRTSGPVGGGQPRTTLWSGTLDLGLGGLLGRKQAPSQGRLPTSSPFRPTGVHTPREAPDITWSFAEPGCE